MYPKDTKESSCFLRGNVRLLLYLLGTSESDSKILESELPLLLLLLSLSSELSSDIISLDITSAIVGSMPSSFSSTSAISFLTMLLGLGKSIVDQYCANIQYPTTTCWIGPPWLEDYFPCDVLIFVTTRRIFGFFMTSPPSHKPKLKENSKFYGLRHVVRSKIRNFSVLSYL